MRFDKKVVLVTGAAKGIGRAVVEAFTNEGAWVAIVDMDKTTADALAQELTGAGKKVVVYTVDISNEGAVQQLFNQLKQTWGHIDILVNNAGIYYQADITATSNDTWNRVLAVNLSGAFLCSKYALTMMPAGGVVVNVASEAGLVGIGGQVAYNVSKAGMIALTRSCAVDLASRGIRVNCVCPGTTDTPLVKEAVNRADDPAAARRQLEAVRPLNRLGKPEEIAAAVLFMSSPEAGYATGSILSIDGGYTTQ